MQVKNKLTIALVGNPNCGKTSVFNCLTGKNQKVGNWSGVTVEKKVGEISIDNMNIEVVDLPGIYSLAKENMSLDEKIAKDYLLNEKPDLILNIADVTHLERHLLLTSQLAEFSIPMILVANMVDDAAKMRINFSSEALQSALGFPVAAISAKRNQGIAELKQMIASSLQQAKPAEPLINIPELRSYQNELEQYIIENIDIDVRRLKGLSLQLLEGSLPTIDCISQTDANKLKEKVEQVRKDVAQQTDILINKARFDFASKISSLCIHRANQSQYKSILDKVSLHKFLGVPIFLLVIYFVFLFSVNFGGAFIDFFDILAGGIFVDGLRSVLEAVHLPEILIIILADGIGGGIQTVLTFIPVIASLFFVLSILEDSGYLARAAVIVDQLMNKCGLSGKAFVPLITGFGCTVAAVMGSSILDRRKDRIITTAMAPFISCGAKLPVYVFIAAVFFPAYGQNIIFILYITGILMAIITGMILQSTVLKSSPQPMIIELPRWQIPILGNILHITWHKIKMFLFRAGKIIIPMVAVISVLNSVNYNFQIVESSSEDTIIADVSKKVTNIFKPLGIQEENWAATVGIISGILAKEVAVGTMSSIYNQLEDNVEGAEEDAFDLKAVTVEAFASIKDNLIDLKSSLLDPIGLNVGNLSETEEVAKSLDLEQSSLTSISKYFDGQRGAFAFLLFILLYMPCGAAMSSIIRMQGWNWGVFILSWCNILAWSSATIFYQAANIALGMQGSVFWIIFAFALLFAFWLIVILLNGGNKQRLNQLID